MNRYRDRIVSRIGKSMPEMLDVPMSAENLELFVHFHKKTPRPASEGPQLYRHAAVLVAIVEHDENPSLLLTLRAAHLGHPHEVSFPGGKVEPGESVAEAALREAEEEIGLARGFVDICGYLDPFETGTGFFVHTVVGFVRPGFQLRIDEGEVAAVFEVPLAHLADPAAYVRKSIHSVGRDRVYYEILYDGYTIWGVTGTVLKLMHDRFFAGPDFVRLQDLI